MRKSNIFIASSAGSQPLAEQLASELLVSKEVARVWTWWDDAMRNPGVTATQLLRDRARESDFVVVALAEDDLTLSKNLTHFAAHGNCIFEAGFFTGALGLDSRRCLLVSNIAPETLPSDFWGLQYVPFREADAQGGWSAIARQIVPVILLQVRSVGPLDRPVLPLVTSSRLMELERIGPGGNLTVGSVLVNGAQPLEEEVSFGNRVMGNMLAGVDYRYFFQGNSIGTGTNFIWAMIQAICLAGLTDRCENSVAPSERLEVMKKDPSAVRENLEFMRNRLRIYFLAHESPFQFRVHNAESSRDARCYVRYSRDSFLEWYKGEPARARAVALELMDRAVWPSGNAETLFCSTRDFDLDAPTNKQFLETLHKGIGRYFIKPLQGKVEEIFWGEEPHWNRATGRF